jgi:hypothetical protein
MFAELSMAVVYKRVRRSGGNDECSAGTCWPRLSSGRRGVCHNSALLAFIPRRVGSLLQHSWHIGVCSLCRRVVVSLCRCVVVSLCRRVVVPLCCCVVCRLVLPLSATQVLAYCRRHISACTADIPACEAVGLDWPSKWLSLLEPRWRTTLQVWQNVVEANVIA